MEISRYIADCIKLRMHCLGINNSQLAGMAGVHPSTVTKWLSGTHNFTVSTLEQIQSALNVNFFSYSENLLACFPCVEHEVKPFKQRDNEGRLESRGKF